MEDVSTVLSEFVTRLQAALVEMEKLQELVKRVGDAETMALSAATKADKAEATAQGLKIGGVSSSIMDIHRRLGLLEAHETEGLAKELVTLRKGLTEAAQSRGEIRKDVGVLRAQVATLTEKVQSVHEMVEELDTATDMGDLTAVSEHARQNLEVAKQLETSLKEARDFMSLDSLKELVRQSTEQAMGELDAADVLRVLSGPEGRKIIRECLAEAPKAGRR